MANVRFFSMSLLSYIDEKPGRVVEDDEGEISWKCVDTLSTTAPLPNITVELLYGYV